MSDRHRDVIIHSHLLSQLRSDSFFEKVIFSFSFYFVHMGILCAWVSVYHLQCLWRPEEDKEDTGFPGTGVIDEVVTYQVGAGNRTCILLEERWCS